MARLDGKRAVITGAGRGIGAAIAKSLYEKGAEVILLGRNLEPLNELVESLGGGMTVALDVTNSDLVSSAFAELGQIDILINNAGGAESAPFHRTDEALWNRMIELNVTGAFRCIQQVLPGMRERKSGRIVNIASTAGLKGYAYVSAYTAAKHALVGLTRSLAAETAQLGITVNAVCPGYTETDMLSDSVQKIRTVTGMSEEEARKNLLADNPLGRFIKPEEVAACVAWLCSSQAASVTGQAIAIDGGEVAR